jgi:hypothetical protein
MVILILGHVNCAVDYSGRTTQLVLIELAIAAMAVIERNVRRDCRADALTVDTAVAALAVFLL